MTLAPVIGITVDIEDGGGRAPAYVLRRNYADAVVAAGGVPLLLAHEVGAVLVGIGRGEVLAAAGNRVIALHDPTAHAEMLAIREGAARVGSERLGECDLYVSLEPCPMCAQAISLARIRRLIFAAYDPKGGGVMHGPRIFDQPGCNHRPEVTGGIEEARAQALLRRFFAERR